MRLVSLALALTLPAAGALAQSIESCPGGDLSNCTVDSNPPALDSLNQGRLRIDPETTPARDAEEGAQAGEEMRPEAPARTNGGGANRLQPNNLSGSSVRQSESGLRNPRTQSPGAPEGALEENLSGDADTGVTDTMPGETGVDSLGDTAPGGTERELGTESLGDTGVGTGTSGLESPGVDESSPGGIGTGNLGETGVGARDGMSGSSSGGGLSQ